MAGRPAPPGLAPLGGQQDGGASARRNPARPPSGPGGGAQRTLAERAAAHVVGPRAPERPPIDPRETQADEGEAFRLVQLHLGAVVTEDWRPNKDRTALVDQISRQVYKYA